VAEDGGVEDGAEGQFAAQPVTDLSGEPGGEQRVAPEMEEVVGEAGAGDA